MGRGSHFGALRMTGGCEQIKPLLRLGATSLIQEMTHRFNKKGKISVAYAKRFKKPQHYC